MNVLLTGERHRNPNRDTLEHLRRAAELDVVGVHRSVRSAEEADVVLRIESGNTLALLDRFGADDRTLVYSSRDDGFPTRPGIYPSVARWNAANGRCRSGPYTLPLFRNELDSVASCKADIYLFSFLGSSATSPMRRRILALKHPQALLRDTGGEVSRQSDFSTQRAFRNRYTESLKASKFVICPRGMGASSIRLFEVLRAGRVPVIISDAWTEPLGPQWNAFSVRVAESKVESIPEHLASIEGQAEEMGRRARDSWDAHFSQGRIFHWFAEQCMEMLNEQGQTTIPHSYWQLGKLLDPRNFRQSLWPRLRRGSWRSAAMRPDTATQGPDA